MSSEEEEERCEQIKAQMECVGPEDEEFEFDYSQRFGRGPTKRRIRDLENLVEGRRCIILPDDPWKLKWNLFLIW